MSDNNTLFISSVNEAIQSSITQNKILLIYLSDESPDSVDFGDKFLVNNDGLKLLLSHFVLLRLIKDTQEFEFFEQVFHNLKIPSVYAIKNGGILDIIHRETEELTLDSFNDRIHTLLTPQNNTSTNNTPITNTTNTTTNTNTNITNNNTNVNNNSNNSEDNETNESVSSRAIRKPTKKYSTLKEESAEMSAKLYRESLQKQQKQAKEEKERILKLLELDKAERHKEALKRKLSKSQIEAVAEIETFKESLKENIRHNKHDQDAEYLIQLKLFNGQSLKKSFPNTTTLSVVRDFINENYPEYQSTPYYFFKPIDRITYSDIDELSKSLKDLKLNRSLIIIKPSDHYGSSSMDLKNGFQNLASQQSSFGWLKSKIGSLFGPVIPDPREEVISNNLSHDDIIEDSELGQSLYSTPVIRSAESTRASTPKPALVVFDSTNNFSIVNNNSSTDVNEDRNSPDDRLVYNGNLLDMEDDKKKKKLENTINNNKNGSGHFTAIGEESKSDS